MCAARPGQAHRCRADHGADAQSSVHAETDPVARRPAAGPGRRGAGEPPPHRRRRRRLLHLPAGPPRQRAVVGVVAQAGTRRRGTTPRRARSVTVVQSPPMGAIVPSPSGSGSATHASSTQENGSAMFDRGRGEPSRRRHPERAKQPLVHQCLHRHARHPLDHAADQAPAEVRVLEPQPGRPGERPARRDQRVHARRRQVEMPVRPRGRRDGSPDSIETRWRTVSGGPSVVGPRQSASSGT